MKQALKRLSLAVLVTLGNGLLAWSVPGPMGVFFKVTTALLLAVVAYAILSLLVRTRKEQKRD